MQLLQSVGQGVLPDRDQWVHADEETVALTKKASNNWLCQSFTQVYHWFELGITYTRWRCCTSIVANHQRQEQIWKQRSQICWVAISHDGCDATNISLEQWSCSSCETLSAADSQHMCGRYTYALFVQCVPVRDLIWILFWTMSLIIYVMVKQHTCT